MSQNDGHFAFVFSLTVYLIWKTILVWNICSMACALFYWKLSSTGPVIAIFCLQCIYRQFLLISIEFVGLECISAQYYTTLL